MATSTNFVGALGGGSGIDIKALAQSLVDAEQTPRKERIDAKIKQSETKVSGYGALKYALSQLKTSFETINDAREFSSIQVSNSQTNALSITTSNAAKPTTFSVEVKALAKPQRITASFSSKTQSLGIAAPFDLTLTTASGTKTINVTQSTPQGMVDAINASTSETQLTAQLINTGQGQQLVINGASGKDNAFNLTVDGLDPVSVNSSKVFNGQGFFDYASASSDATSVNLSFISNDQTEELALVKNDQGRWVLPDGISLPEDATQLATTATRPYFSSLQNAQDSMISVDGIEIKNSTNQISDAIDGVTFTLNSQTVSPAIVELSRQTESIKTNLRSLVNAYNEFEDSVKVLQDRGSEVDIYGGALAGDTLTRRLHDQIKSFFIEDAKPAGSTIKAARDVGISLDRFGKLSLDENKLQQALTNHFDEVVLMFTANKNDKSVYSQSNAGLAGSAVRSLDQMLRSTGLINVQTKNETKKITDYKADLDKLQAQMDRLLERYMQQFSIMDSIVGESSNTRQGLKNSLNSLQGNNNNN